MSSATRLLVLTPLLLLPVCALLTAYPDGPDPKLTGAFGQQNCLKCHQGQRLNAGHLLGGSFQILGVPREYEPGRSYPLKVVISQPGQSRWGFQLTSRFADSGGQAGELAGIDGNTLLDSLEGITYISHSEKGTRAGVGGGPVEFPFEWTAPRSGGLVLFNASGNAADNSGDEEGDYIYSSGAAASPPGAAGQAPPVLAQAGQDAPKPVRRSESPAVINVPAPLDRRRGDFEFQVQHSFFGDIDSGAGGAFGTDLGANVNLALNYALSDRLSAGVTRARTDRIVTLAATFEIKNSGESFWSMDFRGGLEGHDNLQRHYSPFLQLATAFDMGRVRLYITPSMVFNSRRDDRLFLPSRFRAADENHTFSLGLGADVAATDWFSLMGEVIPRVKGFGGIEARDDPAFGGGVKIRSWGHVFSVFVTNSLEFTPATYGISGNRSNDSVSLGFNIFRRIR
ncbi:MAG TPA: DUF5777 family beta-barrel protein [Acidobacteriota bacterium]|nr:DUF5777 family beta-barrel protein [Acidobacteriota bacterium]